MEELLELTRHGSFSLFFTLLLAGLAQVLWRVFVPGLEAAWFYALLTILLVVFACLPNGLHWLLDIRHVDLEAVDRGQSYFPYSLLFLADIAGTALGALVGVLLGMHWRQRG
jgi:hypothetical protein